MRMVSAMMRRMRLARMTGVSKKVLYYIRVRLDFTGLEKKM
jgi:hypothetical protein